MNQYLEEEPVHISDWQENRYLGKLIIDIFPLINRGHDPINGIWNEWNDPKRSSHTVSVQQHLLKGGRLRNQKQNARWHQTQMRENGCSLHFIFISLPTPAVDKNPVSRHIICCTVHLQKMMPCMMFWSIQTFCERQTHWTFTLFHIICHFPKVVFDACK